MYSSPSSSQTKRAAIGTGGSSVLGHACDEVWLAIVATHQTAALLGADPYVRNADGEPIGRRTGPRTDRGRIAGLAEAEKEARERRDRAWAQVVKANDKIVAAQLQVRLRRGGRTRRADRQEGQARLRWLSVRTGSPSVRRRSH
jgi:hypothetical protein